MYTTLPEKTYAGWTHPCYRVRVRNSTPTSPYTYLWGSAGVKKNLFNSSFAKPPILHIHNDVYGQPIDFGLQDESGMVTPYGTLQPNESVSIPLQSITGVLAQCDLESEVDCLIKE